jgi:hypothetical protein
VRSLYDQSAAIRLQFTIPVWQTSPNLYDPNSAKSTIRNKCVTHQGLDNVIPFPDARAGPKSGKVAKAERLGGLLKFYYRQAA